MSPQVLKMSIEFSAREGYLSAMRRSLIWLSLIAWLAAALTAAAATGRVIKVLPQFLDLKGRNSLTPSLYERDNYQVYLLRHTNEISGMRFHVQWKTKGVAYEPVRLVVELRGIARGDFPRQLTLEKTVQPGGGWFGRWTLFDLLGEQYKDFGWVTAWRVTLREGKQLLGEQKSFLW
jgi:hypothetical protein